MYKKLIKFEDYNGQKREMTAYFNLSKAELMEMELSTQAGVDEMIRVLIATKDNAKIMQTYKDLILKSYGIKSEDGTRFIKSEKLREEFEQSAAYSEFFMELLSNSEEQNRFINQVISGVNAPNLSEAEAVAKLKDMGYDTTTIEEVISKKSSEPVQESNIVDIESKPNA